METETTMVFDLNRLPEPARVRIGILSQELRQYNDKEIKINFKLAGMVWGRMDEVLTRDGRIAFLRYVFGVHIQSHSDLLITDIRGVVEWADPRKFTDQWAYSAQFISDLKIIQMALGLIPALETTRCVMCDRGTVLKIIRDPKDPLNPAKVRTQQATCKCCNGDYKHCHLCANLGA